MTRKKPPTLPAALRLPEGPKRTAAVAAWIQGLFREAVPILVGGAAVELYTAGAYTTGDLDFVGQVPSGVARALEAAGFHREGRHWIHERGELFVEFPGSHLENDETTAILEIDGLRVLTLSPEDMIVDRLAAWQFWNSSTDGASAFLIWRAQESNLDQRRLDSLAHRRKLGKALARLRGFSKDLLERDPSSEELEKWASQRP